MSNRSGSSLIFPPDPHQAMILSMQRGTDFSWREWVAVPESRYVERVYERRRNPFSWWGTIALFDLTIFYGAVFLGYGDFFHDAMYLLSPLPRLDHILIGIFALWPTWAVVSRLRARDAGTRRREDSYYPPKEYKEALTDEEIQQLRDFAGL